MSNKKKTNHEREGAQASAGAPLSHGTHALSAKAHAKDGQGRELRMQIETRSPHPPASIVREYEAIQPGLGVRLVNEGFEQGAHRRFMEKRFLNFSILRSITGQVAGVLVAAATLWVGYQLTMAGHDKVGGLALTTTVLGLTTTFVLGKYAQKSERIKKSKVMASVLRKVLPGKSDDEDTEDGDD